MKKRILSILFGLSAFFLIGFTLPGVVSAGPADALNQCNIKQDNLDRLADMEMTCSSPCRYSNADNECGACCILSAVYNITDWVFIALMVISALMIIYGAYMFVIAGNNPDNASKGKSLIMYAAIGIAVAFFSRALPSIVKLVIGV